jgi:hypothetical protein
MATGNFLHVLSEPFTRDTPLKFDREKAVVASAKNMNGDVGPALEATGFAENRLARVVVPGRRAMEALILVAEKGGPTMRARIGIMRASNRHHVPEFNPKGKEPHWGRRKLKRDQ